MKFGGLQGFLLGIMLNICLSLAIAGLVVGLLWLLGLVSAANSIAMITISTLLTTVGVFMRGIYVQQRTLHRLSHTLKQISLGDRDVDSSHAKSAAERDMLHELSNMVDSIQETEEELARNIEESVSSASIKSEFLATMSHEIRTPLNGILGMASLLADSSLNKSQQKYLAAIRDSGESLLCIINDILDFTKLESDHLDLEETDFNVSRTVESVCEILSPNAYAKDVDIGSYIARNVPKVVTGDSGRLRQVLMNLVGNAIKFTENGAVMVEVFTEFENEHEVMLKFQVSDTGTGIPADRKPHLFERFTQADSSISRRYGGTGLGLAICKKIVELMKGHIDYHSTEGEGTTFFFSVPMHKAVGMSNALVKQDILKDVRVLVADDHNFNRHIFKKCLEKQAMRVTVVDDGPSALIELENALKAGDPYNIAILDHLMPNMSGEEVAEYIRVQEGDSYKDLQLLLASSGCTGAQAERFQEKGFSYVLTKPVREETLFRAMVNVLSDGEKNKEIEEKIPQEYQQALSSLKVLVAEDNQINQKFIQLMLGKYVPHLDLASDGVEAVDMARKVNYDMILMDVNMPEMDGIEATRIIRRVHDKQHLTILAVTAHMDVEKHHACLEAGMQDVLTKPVQQTDLIEKMLQHVPEHSLEDEKKQA